MFNSNEREISTAYKNENTIKILTLSLSDVVFITLINVKMQTIVGILTFMSRINFVLSRVEHEKSFITLGPVVCTYMYVVCIQENLFPLRRGPVFCGLFLISMCQSIGLSSFHTVVFS